MSASPSKEPHPTSLDEVLRERFGFDAFREGQRAAVEAAVDGHDLLVVMPTGAGKSLCYQLPATIADGFTLVVSPLVALMKDQVDSMRQRGIRAAAIYAGLPIDEKRAVATQMQDGTLDVVLVAPERFRSPKFLPFLRSVKPARLVVDEAHCISQWGHDFRPDYLRLGEVAEALAPLPMSALTATATDAVRKDVAIQLGLREPVEVLTGFDRPNLRFEVLQAPSRVDKGEQTLAALRETQGVRLIYAASRKAVEELGQTLRDAGYEADVYHAGRSDRDRTEVQDRFMGGELEVLVATNAFGMGVDKADIRLVLHHDMPGSLEAYYQEAGRAGRDGEPARCVLLRHGGDYRTQRFFIDGANPSPELVRQVFNLVRDHDATSWTLDELRDETKEKNLAALRTVLRLLVAASPQGLSVDNDMLLVDQPDALPGTCAVDSATLGQKRRRDNERLGAMLDYVQIDRGCRFKTLRAYFTTREGDNCGSCDLCTGEELQLAPADTATLARIRTVLRLVHDLDVNFGAYRLARILGDKETPDFVKARMGSIPRLTGESETSIRGLLEFMGQEDLLAREEFTSADGARSGTLLDISSRGRAVLLHDEVPDLPPLPDRAQPGRSRTRGRSQTKPAAEVPANVDQGVLESLRRFRQQRAREIEKPAYIIFTDKTLHHLAATKPTDEGGFLATPGLGPKKWQDFGAEILATIRNANSEA